MSDPHDSNLRRAADFCRDLGRHALAEAISRAIDRIAALEAELEHERIRLAACGVVAGANTRDSAAKVRQMSPEYRSASLDDVERAVDREIAERERREAAEALLRGVRTSTIYQLDYEIAPLIDAHFARYKD